MFGRKKDFKRANVVSSDAVASTQPQTVAQTPSAAPLETYEPAPNPESQKLTIVSQEEYVRLRLDQITQILESQEARLAEIDSFIVDKLTAIIELAKTP